MKSQKPTRDIAFWPNAQIIYALSLIDEKSIIKKQIILWRKRGFKIERMDDILMGYYLISKTNLLTNEQYERLISSIKGAVESYIGRPLPYRISDPNIIYADLLGMAPQTIIKIGLEEKDNNLVEWGTEQFLSFIKNATDDVTGLPYHAYNTKTKEKLGIIGWGRTLGWIMTGLSASINELENNNIEKREKLEKIYLDYIRIVKKYIRKDIGIRIK